jgi:hypothetical protein
MNVRDAFYEVLRAHGINTIFGNPGRGPGCVPPITATTGSGTA